MSRILNKNGGTVIVTVSAIGHCYVSVRSIRSRCNWHVLDGKDTEMNFLFLRYSLRHVQRESELNYIPIDSSGSGRAEIIDDGT